MRRILSVVCLCACGGGSGGGIDGGGDDGSGGSDGGTPRGTGRLLFSAEVGANNLFDGTVAIAETDPNIDQDNTVFDVLFVPGTVADGASLHVAWFGPPAVATWAIGDHKVAELRAGEAVVFYAEGGMARRWQASSGTLTISAAAPPMVEFQITGVTMFPNGTSGSLGTFTLDGEGTTTAWAP